MRAGTENVPYIAGLGLAAEIAQNALDYELKEVKRLRDKLEEGILKNVFNARLNTSLHNRVPNTTNIGFEYVEGELILLHLSDLGICASSGSACTSGSLEPSLCSTSNGNTIYSITWFNKIFTFQIYYRKEIDYVIENMPSIMEKLTKISPFQDELEILRRR